MLFVHNRVSFQNYMTFN